MQKADVAADGRIDGAQVITHLNQLVVQRPIFPAVCADLAVLSDKVGLLLDDVSLALLQKNPDRFLVRVVQRSYVTSGVVVSLLA